MAPRSLMVRWRKDKMRRRLTRPKAFSTKGAASLTKHAFREEAMFKHAYRGGGGADRAFERLKHYIQESKPHHRYLHMFFTPAIREASEKVTDDPKLLVELLLQRYIEQDESLAAFKFDVIVLERSDFHQVWMYFRGQDCFLLYRRNDELFKSVMYKNPMFLKRLSLKKIVWAGEPVQISHLDDNS